MTRIAYVYDAQRNLVRARAEGLVRAGDLLAYVRSVLGDDAIRPGFVELVDFGPVEDLVVSYSQLSPFRQVWRKYLAKGVRATILYAPGEASYGICRMFQSVIDPEGDLATGPFGIVRTPQEMGARLAELGITDLGPGSLP